MSGRKLGKWAAFNKGYLPTQPVFKSNTRLRERLCKQRGNKCEECGSNKNLTLHHKNHNKKDNRPINLLILCRSCHNAKDFASNGGRETRREAVN